MEAKSMTIRRTDPKDTRRAAAHLGGVIKIGENLSRAIERDPEKMAKAIRYWKDARAVCDAALAMYASLEAQLKTVPDRKDAALQGHWYAWGARITWCMPARGKAELAGAGKRRMPLVTTA